MRDWTKAPPAQTATASGVLRPEVLDRYVDRYAAPASDRLSRWVENYWALRWRLPEDVHFTSSTLPHPACSLTVERGSHPRPPVVAAGEPVVVTGVPTRRFDVDVRGWGWVVGVKFRPGGLVALAGGTARSWTDRVVAARSILPLDTCATLAGLDPAATMADWVDGCEQALDAVPHLDTAEAPDRTYERLLAVIADMLDDDELLRVADVEERHGVSARTLSRWFRRYVGVGPKWVLARYRMHNVVERLDDGYDGPLTELAYRYGWFDQAHFTRDFVRLVGETPGQYRDRSRPQRTQAPESTG